MSYCLILYLFTILGSLCIFLFILSLLVFHIKPFSFNEPSDHKHSRTFKAAVVEIYVKTSEYCINVSKQ